MKEKLGCVVLLAVFLLVGYVGWKIGKVFIDNSTLASTVEEEARFFQAKSDEEILKKIYDKAADLGIDLDERRIEVTRPSRQSFKIRLSYRVDVAFPFDKHFRREFVIEKSARSI